MSILIVLLENTNIYHASLEEDGKISFGSGKKDSVAVSSFTPSQITVTNKKEAIYFYAKKPYNFEQQLELNSIAMIDKEKGIMLYAVKETEEKPVEIDLPYSLNLKFGRSDKNDIALKFPFVSGEHFIFRYENGSARIEDLNSTNGIYLNNKRVEIAKMKSGDTLFIMSIRIRLLNGRLIIENAGNKIIINKMDDYHIDNSEKHANDSQKRLIYKRSPRAQEKLPEEDIILANAPTKTQGFEKGRGLGMFSSLAGSGAMLGASIVTGMASPALLVARMASLISPVVSAATMETNGKRNKKYKKLEAQRLEIYGAYIENQKARIGKVADLQREILTRENPDIDGCVSIAEGLRRKLWERSCGDRDFLDVRIGMGYEDLCVNVKARQEQSVVKIEDDEADMLAEQIIEETRIVDNIPARVSLYSNSSIGIVGSRKNTVELMKNMLVELCTLHCHEDVKIAGIFDEKEKNVWESVRWLPHFNDDDGQFKLISFDAERAHELCEYLTELIKLRFAEGKASEKGKKSGVLPHYVIIFGSKNAVEHEEIMNHLFSENIDTGITSVFLFDELYNLPHKCKYIIDVDNGPCHYDSADVNRKFYYTQDKPISESDFDTFARRMSAIELSGFSQRAEIPGSITFLKGFGVEKVDELDVYQRWSKSLPYVSLAAPIGVMAGDKAFALDIHEKAHGPHGLVAGTTGSGKSELLQTWILSMAVNFHPHDVAFVLIDYKGGGMANLLEPLPHVVGKITNIGSNIGRSLISLQSEIKRRQIIFDEVGVNHIDKYQKLYRGGGVCEPLPHLIIVADEFAELKKEEPDFMAGLISASRVGRSLGIHLVLATQKPGGIVDDQIQSNSRFRLCLKVQDVNDSREMIRRPDAARITRAGRAFVRVGEDECFELFQSYWSGAEYSDNTVVEKKEPEIDLVDLYGNRVEIIKKKKASKKSDTDELTAVVNYIKRTAEERRIKKLRGPWLPELSELIPLQEVCAEITDLKWPLLPIGIFDNPKNQSQGVQYIDFSEQGHCAIYGASGTGKTTLLKTIILSICRCWKPGEVSAYIIDAGGWSLSAFSEMPNIGGIALDSEEEKIDKLQKLIMAELDSRKRIFLKNSVSSLKTYRQDISEDLPAIVIVVDNIVPLFDLYPDIENFFITIARDGATYGIYLIYTASSTSGVRYKVVQNTKGAITFELTDKGDYSTIVGRPDSALPKIPGRAFFKGNPPMQFQAAVPYKAESDRAVNDAVKAEAEILGRRSNGFRPAPIPVMDDSVDMKKIERAFPEREQIPIGISYETIMPVGIDLAKKYSMLVTGPIKSGKSAFLIKTAELVCRRDAKTKLIVFDSAAGALKSVKGLCYAYSADNDEENVTKTLGNIVSMLNERKNAEKQGAASGDFEQICIIIDDLRDFVDAVSNDSKNTMERICRMAGGLAVAVIAAGRLSDMLKYSEIESLTRLIISNQNGFITSGYPAMYPFFNNSLKFSEKNIEAGEGNGYVFINGECIKIKKAE